MVKLHCLTESYCNKSNETSCCLQVFTVGPSGTRLLMWAATGNHRRQWTYANVILSNPAPFRVTFEAEVGGDMWTDIALDDISYTAECMSGGTPECFFLPSLLFHLVFPSFQHHPHFSFHSPQFSPSPISPFFHIFCLPTSVLPSPVSILMVWTLGESVVRYWSLLPCRSIWIQCRDWVNAEGQYGLQWRGKAITLMLCCFLTLTLLSFLHPWNASDWRSEQASVVSDRPLTDKAVLCGVSDRNSYCIWPTMNNLIILCACVLWFSHLRTCNSTAAHLWCGPVSVCILVPVYPRELAVWQRAWLRRWVWWRPLSDCGTWDSSSSGSLSCWVFSVFKSPLPAVHNALRWSPRLPPWRGRVQLP